MAASNSTTTPPNHLPWLDWCRFLAAFVVVIVHARAFTFASYGSIDADQQHWITAAFYMATRIGTQGVLVFFVLSGFLVGGKAIERFRDGTFRLGDYTIDRLSRIGVPYVPVLIFTVIVAHVTGMETANLGLFFGNLFFLQGISVEPYPSNEPLWSLSYEVWFYILAGACCVVGEAGGKQLFRFVIVIAALSVFSILKPIYLLCWILGALAWFGRPKVFKRSGLAAGLVLAVYGMIGVQLFSEAQTASINQALSNYSGYFVSYETAQFSFCAGFALIVQQLILMPPKGQRLPAIEAFGTKLAAFSYTLYLVHNPVLHLLRWGGLERANHFSLESIIRFSGSVALCLVAAIILYSLFERHTALVRRSLKNCLIKANPKNVSRVSSTN